MKRILLTVFAVILTISCTDTVEIEKLQKEIDNLKMEKDSLIQYLNDKKPAINPWFNSDYEGRRFKKIGVSNPEEFIEKNLRKNPGLIPLEAVLGGTMDYRNIQLLSSKWLIAEYDDGHIQGRESISLRSIATERLSSNSWIP